MKARQQSKALTSDDGPVAESVLLAAMRNCGQTSREGVLSREEKRDSTGCLRMSRIGLPNKVRKARSIRVIVEDNG